MMLPLTLCRTARSVHPEPGLKGVLARTKYLVRAAARPSLTAQWFAILREPHLAPLVQSHPHILSKLQRPYLHRRLTAAGRLAALQSHYRFVSDSLDGPIRREIFIPEGFRLAGLAETGLTLEPYSLRLFYGDQFAKEGELTLGLFADRSVVPLTTLTFCVSNFGSGLAGEIFIGGLQSQGGAGVRERIVELTRLLHGLRPKALLVFAIQRLAQTWGISRLTAVGLDEHIYRHYLKRKQVHADYDAFWSECQGVRLPDGNFQLPPVPQARKIEELARNKRPLYRRRYEMLARLGEEITAAALGVEWPALDPMLPPLEIEDLTLSLPHEDQSLLYETEMFEAL